MLRVLSHIAAARERRTPVVALESSVFAQGLPVPANRVAFERMSAAITAHRAIPAVTAVVGGTPTVGLAPDEVERFLARRDVEKVSARDLPLTVARGGNGATTVAASLAICALAG